MCCKGFIKRVTPFFLTFAFGLFIASFFISIAAPTWTIRGRGWERHQQRQRIESENERLRDENLRLKKQLADDSISAKDLKYLDVPPVPPMPPAPPAPPAPVRRR